MFIKTYESNYASIFLVIVFSCLLSAFIEFRQLAIANFVPYYNDLNYISPWVCLFLFGLLLWIAVLRKLGLESRLSIVSGFYFSFVIFILLALLPPLIGQLYLVTSGLMGMLIGAYFLVPRLRSAKNWLVVTLAAFAGLLTIPAIWSAVGWILFSLPHPDLLTMFSITHGSPVAVFDLLHFLSYSQMIHEHGVPSVGMNGLAFHNYHWLAGFPVASLAGVSGMEVPNVVGSFTGTFLVPYFCTGILFGAMMASSSVLSRVFSVVFLCTLYGVASQNMPTISFGLVFISPSTALSLALFAPLSGMVVGVLAGHIDNVNRGHVWLSVLAVVLIGLAKVTTLPHAIILVFALCSFFVWRGGASASLKLHAVAALVVSGLAAAFIIYVGVQQLRSVVAEPAGYSAMLESLSPGDRSLLLDDIEASRASQAPNRSMGRTDYEKLNFWGTGSGIVSIALVAVLFAAGFISHWRKGFHVKLAVFLSVIGLFSYLTLRLVVGQQTPVQAMYVLLPLLVFGAYLFGNAITRGIAYFCGAAIFDRNRTIGLGALIAVLVLFSSGSIVAAVLAEKRVAWVAADRAVVTLGQLANVRGKGVIRAITFERAQTFRFGNYPDWPEAYSRYWSAWDSRPLSLIAKEARVLADATEATGGRVALFVPVSHAFWFQSDHVSKSLWFPGVVGVPLYRGRMRREDVDGVSAYRGRGFSDFGHEASSPINSFDNVHCWSRFEGWTIIELGAAENKLKC